VSLINYDFIYRIMRYIMDFSDLMTIIFCFHNNIKNIDIILKIVKILAMR